MKGDRNRIPIDKPYLDALGLAVICFTRLEWQAVYCCQKFNASYVSGLGKKMSMQIANDLAAFAPTHSDPAVQASLGKGAADFKNLVTRRNDLLHAKPGTNAAGQQRLFRQSHEWSIPALEDLADDFAAAEIVLNHHYYNVL